jgi:hypothetical protein
MLRAFFPTLFCGVAVNAFEVRELQRLATQVCLHAERRFRKVNRRIPFLASLRASCVITNCCQTDSSDCADEMVSEGAPCMFDIVGTSAMARPALSSQLSPDELKELAETQIAQATQIEPGPERLRVLTVADALMNLAEIKKLLLDYERRLLN